MKKSFDSFSFRRLVSILVRINEVPSTCSGFCVSLMMTQIKREVGGALNK